MTDPTAGRSAGTPLNATLDPMGYSDEENRRLAADNPKTAATEPREAGTAGRPPGTAEHVEQDPTRTVRRAPRG